MKPLAITLGDPAGIGPEIVFKALAQLDVPAIVFGSRTLTEPHHHFDRIVRFEDVGGPADPLRYGSVDATYGRVALDSIDAAIRAIEAGECSALVTAPIHKAAIAAAGATFPGHTELLAHRAGLDVYGRDYAMYFDSPTICVVLLTVHVSLREAIDAITAQRVADLARLTSRELERLHGRPVRIGVAAVNPHAGEGGRFGSEEAEIARGVALAREAGIDVAGPFPADTLFLNARSGHYDVVMAMYHDQGLIPVKTLEFERSVNVTLGLPYLRASVDHGTAFDIAGKGVASEVPMRYAIEWTAQHATRYSR
jgi:4-hydroxythreonine-4-phosphate dehydrogenase